MFSRQKVYLTGSEVDKYVRRDTMKLIDEKARLELRNLTRFGHVSRAEQPELARDTLATSCLSGSSRK